ncbi:MAG: hypothetical protein ACT4OY_03215 [Alphaproteobacteria bacterium]
MSYPDLEYLQERQTKQPKRPVLIEMDAHHKRLFVDRAAYNSLSPNDKKTYLKNLEAELQANVKSAKNPDRIYTQVQKDEYFKDAKEYLQTGEANAYAHVDVNDDGAVDSFDFILMDSKSQLKDFVEWASEHGLEPLRFFTELENKINTFLIFKHENAHSMFNLCEPGSDYIAAWETLQKYGPGAIDVLERRADQRMLESVFGNSTDESAKDYGYECALAICEAIKNYRTQPGFTQSKEERDAAYKARSGIKDYAVSLYGDGFSPGNNDASKVLTKPASLDPLEWARYYDEQNGTNEIFFGKLPQDLQQDIDKEMQTLFENKAFQERLKEENFPAVYGKYTPVQKSRLLARLSPNLSDELYSRLTITREEETDNSYPEIAVRRKLISLARREDVANALGLPGETLFSGENRLNRLNGTQLRQLMNIAGKEDWFKDAGEDERNAFETLKQALEREMSRNKLPVEEKPQVKPSSQETSKPWFIYFKVDDKSRDLFTKFSKEMQSQVDDALKEALEKPIPRSYLKDYGFPLDIQSYTSLQKLTTLEDLAGIFTNDMQRKIDEELARVRNTLPEIVVLNKLIKMVDDKKVRDQIGMPPTGLFNASIAFHNMSLTEKYKLMQLAAPSFENSPPEVQEIFRKVKEEIENDFRKLPGPAVKTSLQITSSASFFAVQI